MLPNQRKQAQRQVTVSWDCFTYGHRVAVFPPVLLGGKKTVEESTNVKSSWGANKMVVVFCSILHLKWDTKVAVFALHLCRGRRGFWDVWSCKRIESRTAPPFHVYLAKQCACLLGSMCMYIWRQVISRPARLKFALSLSSSLDKCFTFSSA